MTMNHTNSLNIIHKAGHKFLYPFLLFAVFFAVSCSGKDRKAEFYLSEAEHALTTGNYALAKLKIDSIKIKFPESFEVIRKGFDLMQDVRMAENKRNIYYCDSMLSVNYSILNDLKKQFTYERDPQYQEFGNYIPNIFPLKSALMNNGLRAAVGEKGAMYIESVLLASNIKHNQIKVSTKDGAYAESLSVTTDGLNYQFKTLDGSYEIVRFQGNDDNGVAMFIFTYKDEPLTLTFIGSGTRTIDLYGSAKKAIAQSFELSTLLLEIENLKYEKGRSEALINYLEHKTE